MVTKQRNLAKMFESIDSLQCYAEDIKDYLDSLDSERTAGALVERYGTFVKWAREVEQQEQRQVRLLPVTPSDLVDYAKALDDRGLALSTITSYVSAIGTIHSAVNKRSPTRSRVVKAEIAKLRARHADAQRHARPLSDDEIDRILEVLPLPRRSKGGHLELPETARKRALMEKALLLTMIYAGMRVSEASVLVWGDVREEADGPGKVRLRTNWTRHKERWVSVSTECIQALEDMKPDGAVDSDRVFDISPRHVDRLLKKMCAEAGIDPEDISGHTPRATLRRILDESGWPDNRLNDQLRIMDNTRG